MIDKGYNLSNSTRKFLNIYFFIFINDIFDDEIKGCQIWHLLSHVRLTPQGQSQI